MANLYLDKVDEEITGRGVRLVRYADDFVLLCKRKKTAENALEDIKNLLAEHGLELHPQKTKITSFKQGFRFLGHVFVRSLLFQDTALDETPREDALEAIQLTLSSDTKAEQKRLKEIDADPAAALSGSTPEDSSLSRRWRTFYVLEPGRRLAVSGEAFVVMEGETRLLGISAAKVGRIEIGKDVLIDTAALDLASDHQVPLVRLNGYGAPCGKWLPTGMDHAKRHLAQFSLSTDEARSLGVARKIVEAQIMRDTETGRKPDAICVENGPEYISGTLHLWAQKCGIELIYSAGKALAKCLHRAIHSSYA